MSINESFPSHAKSSKPTMRFTPSPLPLREESSIISLNFQDLKTLMKKKEKQYQEELQIADAQRVHHFLSEIEHQKKQQASQLKDDHKRKLRSEVYQYNTLTLSQFEKEWKERLAATIKQLEELGRIASEQHQAQYYEAEAKLEDAKNGKDIEKMKFSKSIIEMEDQLRRLAKSQRYEEAEVVARKLQNRKKEQMREYLRNSVERQRLNLHKIKQRQELQKKVLQQKLQQIYKKQQKQHTIQTERLVKNMKTYEIDLGKIESKVNRISRTQSGRKNRTASRSGFLETSEIKEIREIREVREDHIVEFKDT